MSSSLFSDNGEQGDHSPCASPDDNNKNPSHSHRESVVFHTNNDERSFRKGDIEMEPLSSNKGDDHEKEMVTIFDSNIVTAFKTAEQTVSLRLGDGLGPLRAVSDDLIAYATNKDMETDIHLASLEELRSRFNTDLKTGISSSDIERRMLINGKNVLSPPRTENFLVKLLKLFVGGFNWLLVASAILLILSWNPLGDPPNPTNWCYLSWLW